MVDETTQVDVSFSAPSKLIADATIKAASHGFDLQEYFIAILARSVYGAFGLMSIVRSDDEQEL